MVEKKIFFNGLNELRAFAALFVLFHHIELFKKRDNILSIYNSNLFSYFISTSGKNGVYLFFVLSGFLITYLLLKEKEKHKTILFKNFFMRRIFRIWPLYYLIVIIGFILIPFLVNNFDIFQKVPYYYELISNTENYSIKSILLYVLFLPNVALKYYRVAGCSQSWSVGVEEQFYILWPFLIFLFSKKIIIRIFILLLSVFLFFHFYIQPSFFYLIPKNSSFQEMILPRIYHILKILPIEFMTIGAIGGYVYMYYSEKIILFLSSKYIYLIILFFTFILLFFSLFSEYFQNIVLSFLFLTLILATIQDSNPIVFRNKWVSYLGKISFGIYMYHPFVMFLVFSWANTFFKDSLLEYNIFVYFFVLLITFIFSHISYKYFESKFIKIKDTRYKSI